MNNGKKLGAALLAGLLLLGAGCASQNEGISGATIGGGTSAGSSVAASGEMAPEQSVGEEGMIPVPGTKIKDGSYPVVVDTSSPMFNVTRCVLTVEDGAMTAVMTMSGTGYKSVFPGTGAEAAAASREAYIPYVETPEGLHTFTIPVEALDQEIPCAAFSKNKSKWYDRTLVFRADSLPATAYKEGVVTTLEDLELEDGLYQVEVRLTGGSGRAGIVSPTQLEIKDGTMTAVITWNSPNYDYMKVNGEQYNTQVVGGQSTVEIPVPYLDFSVPVLADTVAMSTPHEIEYGLRFDSASITPSAP